MKHVVLKSDPNAWVDLRDQGQVPERLRRPVRRLQALLAGNPAFAGVVKEAAKTGAAAVEDFSEDQAVAMVAGMGGEAFDLMDQLNDLAVLGRVMGWSFGPEVTAEVLQDQPGAVYDELRALCADGALDTTSAPDFSPTVDPASPTEPSSA